MQVVPITKSAEENRSAAVRTMVGGTNDVPIMTFRP